MAGFTFSLHNELQVYLCDISVFLYNTFVVETCCSTCTWKGSEELDELYFPTSYDEFQKSKLT